MRRALALALLACATVSACGTLQRAPQAPRDLATIPEPVPRREPRSRYGNPESYEVFGKTYRVQRSARGHIERGLASWYGPGFHAERTASGETYDMYAMTAAHKTLPIPTYLRVTNLKNNRSVIVRVNDRGPFVGGRIIDLSYTAAHRLDMIRDGTAPVEIRAVDTAEPMFAERTARRPAPARATAPDTPSVTSPVASPSVTSPVTSPGAGGLSLDARFLQTGSFAEPANAESMVRSLAAAGIRNTRIREARLGDRRVYRVQVGPVEGALEADDMVERLRLAGIPDARPAHE